jgi:hypothetical protein
LGSDSSSDARTVIRHCWITDEDEDSCEGRASKDTDQQELDSIRVQEWLVRVKQSAEEDAREENAVVETLLWRMLRWLRRIL